MSRYRTNMTLQNTAILLLRQKQPPLRLPLPRSPTLSHQKCLYRNRHVWLCSRSVYVTNGNLMHSGEVLIMADTWTIRAVGQDEFTDVPVPDAPVQQAAAPHTTTVKSAGSA